MLCVVFDVEWNRRLVGVSVGVCEDGEDGCGVCYGDGGGGLGFYGCNGFSYVFVCYWFV